MEQSINLSTFQKVRQNLKNDVMYFMQSIRNNAAFKNKLLAGAFICFAITMIFNAGMLGFCKSTDWAMRDSVKSYVETIFGTGTGFGSITSIKDKVNITLSNGGVKIGNTTMNGSVYTLVSTGNRVFKNFGLALLTIWFLIGLIDEASINQMYIEKLVKKFFIYFIGFMLIAKSLDITFAITNIGTAITNGLYSNIQTDVGQDLSGNVDKIMNSLDNGMTSTEGLGKIKSLMVTVGNIAKAIPILLQLIVPYFICMLCGVIVEVTCWSRFFEILLLAIISPIAFADITKGPIEHTSAIRFLKNLLALALTGAMILVVSYLCRLSMSSIVSGSISEGTGLTATNMTVIWQCVIISIAQLGLVKRSTEIVKSALGMA